MTEACKAVIDFSFSKIGVLSVYAHHHVNNPASGRVLIKCGLRYIETKHTQISDCEQINGDYLYYEMSETDWQKNK